MKRYKVLLVGMYPPPYGGITVHIERLKQILDKSENYKCYVLDFSGVRSNKKNKDKNIILIRGNKIVKLIKALAEIKKFNGDIIHFHVSAFGNFKYVGIILTSFNRKTKKILTIHSGSFVENYNKCNWLQRKIIKWNLKMFDYIVTVNKVQANFIKDSLKMKNKITIIPAFLPPKYPENISLKNQIINFRKKFKKVIITSGSMLKHYGFDLIIEALEEIIDEHSYSAGLIIVSYTKEDVNYKNKILKMIKDHENIKFYQDLTPADFVTLLKESNIFIRATDRDGDAVSLREAIFFNKQVIASDCVERPKGVMLFKTMDKKALKDKIKNVLDDPNLGKSISNENYYEKLLNLYGLVISGRKEGDR